MVFGGGQSSWRADILEPAWRFPLPVLFTVVATLVNWDWLEHRPEAGSSQLALSLFCIAAFSWSWAAALWAERHSDWITGLLAGLGGAVLLALIFRLDLAVPAFLAGSATDPRAAVTLSHGVLTLALTLTPALAPYLAPRASQSAFWQYNHKWVVGYLAACLGAAFAFAGVAAVIGTMALLIEVPAPGWLYGNVRVVSLFLVMPWIWLALAPIDFTEPTRTGANQEFTSRAIGMLVIYILIPVTFALSAVLAAYVVKSMVTGTFWTARLGMSGVAYGAGVIAVMLMAYPQREQHALVRLFWRAWPFMLIAPTLLIFPLLWVRVAEYGWTPSRFYAAVLGVWIAVVMAIGLIMRGNEDLRLIPGVLAVLLAVTAFGPWGVADVSGRSQYSRLEGLLTAKGLLLDGRWRETHSPIPWDRASQAGLHSGPGAAVQVGESDRKIANSALDTLSSINQLDRLRPWFAGQANSPFEAGTDRAVQLDRLQRTLGLRPVAPEIGPGRIFFSQVSPTVIPLPGEPGTLIGPVALTVLQQRQSFDTTVGKVTVALDARQVLVDVGPRRVAAFDLTPTLDTMKSAVVPAGGPPPQRQALMLEAGEGPKTRLAITFMSGNIAQPEPNLQLTAYLILPPAP
jgi:uncharacterized protein DUF4153